MSERYRHEDISSVPVGWKVRTVSTSHGHRVRVAFPPGRRQKGSGRLVSILHPLHGANPCSNGCSARSQNPAELMVMSANPPRRRNAEAKRLAREVQARQKKIFKCPHCVQKFSAEEVESGRFREHIAEHRRGQRNPQIEVVHAENPPVDEIVEEFTGQQPKWIDVYNEPHMNRGRYAQLGPLVALYVKPVNGGAVVRIGAPEQRMSDFERYWNGNPPLIVTDSSARQLYFVDGSQDITPMLAQFGARETRPGFYELGEVRRIDYQCRKENVADPEVDLWKHDHGEEHGSRPTLLFDSRHKRLLYQGGNYRIEGPWIRN